MNKSVKMYSQELPLQNPFQINPLCFPQFHFILQSSYIMLTFMGNNVVLVSYQQLCISWVCITACMPCSQSSLDIYCGPLSHLWDRCFNYLQLFPIKYFPRCFLYSFSGSRFFSSVRVLS